MWRSMGVQTGGARAHLNERQQRARLSGARRALPQRHRLRQRRRHRLALTVVEAGLGCQHGAGVRAPALLQDDARKAGALRDTPGQRGGEMGKSASYGSYMRARVQSTVHNEPAVVVLAVVS